MANQATFSIDEIPDLDVNIGIADGGCKGRVLDLIAIADAVFVVIFVL
ncbi:hypothetical protein [Caulobacter sp. 1776]